MISIAATAAAAGGTGTSVSTPSTPSPKLVHAAHEFEAQMMQELLKPLTSGNGLDGQDDDSASGSTGALGQFASEALGQALSEQGGFGIATGIIKELSAQGNAQGNSAVTSQVTGNLRGNTVLRFHE